MKTTFDMAGTMRCYWPQGHPAKLVVVLPSPATLEEETGIVVKRVLEIGSSLELPPIRPADEELVRVVTVFRELRDGKTLNGKTKLKSPTGSLSTAEAISVG